MKLRLHLRLVILLALAGVLLGTARSWGQELDDPMPLGDLARELRKEHQSVAVPSVIDNDNLSKVMDEVESRRMSGSSLLFSFDGDAKTFRVSAPDVTCSLSFNAQATSLLADPYVSRDLPQTELPKLEGPATIDGDNLEVSVFNGTTWRVDEITVGVTIVKRSAQTARLVGSVQLVPASSETTVTQEKRPDITTLYKMRAAAAPFATTMFRTGLNAPLAPDEEWHWAIVQAKGIPPRPASVAQGSP